MRKLNHIGRKRLSLCDGLFIVANIKQSNGMHSRSVLCIYMSASGHVAFGECTLASLGAMSTAGFQIF